MKPLDSKPLAGSVGTGLIASLCCGGSLIFGSIGLGAVYGALGLSRYIPQALAAGALCIAIINYLSYRRAAKHTHPVRTAYTLGTSRRTMFASATLGIAAMVIAFVFLEWLNHAVVNAHRFMSRPELAQALIPGVANVNLLYALASFSALAFLWALPWPHLNTAQPAAPVVLPRILRAGVLVATAGVVVVLIANAAGGGAGGHGGGHQNAGTPQQGSTAHGSR